MFKLRNVTLLFTKLAHFKFDTGLKKVGRGQQRAEKAKTF